MTYRQLQRALEHLRTLEDREKHLDISESEIQWPYQYREAKLAEIERRRDSLRKEFDDEIDTDH